MTLLLEQPPAAPVRPRGRRLRRTALLLALVVLAGLVLASRLGGSPPVRSVLIGRPAPGLTGSTLTGEPFDLAAWRGDVVVVNVWASWCLPCRREQPVLVQAYRDLSPRGLRMVGINVRDDGGQARAFLAKYGKAPWPSVVDPDGRRAVDWGTFALPETYVVDRSGTIVAKGVGEVDQAWITANVAPLLAAP